MNEKFSIGEINFGVDQSTNRSKIFSESPPPELIIKDLYFDNRILPIVRSKEDKPKRQLFLESFSCSIPKNGDDIVVFGKKEDGTKIVELMKYDDSIQSQKLFFMNNKITHWIFAPF